MEWRNGAFSSQLFAFLFVCPFSLASRAGSVTCNKNGHFHQFFFCLHVYTPHTWRKSEWAWRLVYIYIYIYKKVSAPDRAWKERSIGQSHFSIAESDLQSSRLGHVGVSLRDYGSFSCLFIARKCPFSWNLVAFSCVYGFLSLAHRPVSPGRCTPPHSSCCRYMGRFSISINVWENWLFLKIDNYVNNQI